MASNPLAATAGRFLFPQSFLAAKAPEALAQEGESAQAACEFATSQPMLDNLNKIFSAATSEHDSETPLTIDPAGSSVDVSDGFRDWTVRIRFKKFEMRESFAVHIFLKAPPEDPIEWIGADGYVGSHYAFVNSTMDQCANCVNRSLTIDEGYVHLNGAIAKYSGLHTFHSEEVEPYLKEELKWRVQQVSNVSQGLATSFHPPLSG